MDRSLKQEGTRRGTLPGKGRQKGGMFGESAGPVDNIPSDAPLGGNRKCTEQGVPAQRAGFSRAFRLAVRNEANLVRRLAYSVAFVSVGLFSSSFLSGIQEILPRTARLSFWCTLLGVGRGQKTLEEKGIKSSMRQGIDANHNPRRSKGNRRTSIWALPRWCTV
jgi:hypothetical protein